MPSSKVRLNRGVPANATVVIPCTVLSSNSTADMAPASARSRNAISPLPYGKQEAALTVKAVPRVACTTRARQGALLLGFEESGRRVLRSLARLDRVAAARDFRFHCGNARRKLVLRHRGKVLPQREFRCFDARSQFIRIDGHGFASPGCVVNVSAKP